MKEMMTTGKKIMNIYIPLFFAVFGTLFLINGVLLQTECFKLEYVSWDDCGIAALIGLALGMIAMRYLKRQSEKGQGGKRVTPMDLSGMILGYEILYVICFIILYPFCLSVSFLLFAIGCMVFCLTSIIYYLVWLRAFLNTSDQKKKA